MDSSKIFIVLCLVGLLVVGINGILFLAFRHSGTIRQIEILRKATNAARNPWEKEDAALEELSKRVAELKKDRTDKK